MDLNIELTKLYSLHKASMLLEHGVRENGQLSLPWRPFVPSRFVYAYFTFNSIYSFDWKTSFSENKSDKWERKPEKEQFCELVEFYKTMLKDEAHILFRNSLNSNLCILGIANPEDSLINISVINEEGRMKSVRRKFKGNFEKIRQSNLNPDEFRATLYSILSFVYSVRCNIFHGTKTKIEMENSEQQHRLLIYTAILLATNSLLFEAAPKIGTWKVPLKEQF